MRGIPQPRIETARLLLRQISKDDLDEWTRIKYADPEVMRYMPFRDLAPRERAEKAFEFFVQIWLQHDYGAWMVTDKSNGRLLGDCYLEPESESGSGEIEIGYTFGRAYWGQGLATEAGRAVVRYAFENTDIERILGVALPKNIGSWRVLEHIGFEFEKKAHLYNLDVLVYAITRERYLEDNDFYRVYTP